MSPPGTPRVFVSYSRTDSLEFARRLQALLEREGLSLYRDLNDLEGGEDWWRQIEEAIRTVEHVVLVLSPAALRSPFVEREWKLARQEGRKVVPISGPGDLDFSHLPRWMERAHRHDINVPESRERLIQVLHGPASERRVPFMADALPDGFVARPHEFDALKRRLLDARGDPVAITAALRGAGGYGKTALANALCHDDDIQDAFSDGILRVTLGEKPDDVLGRFVDLVGALTGDRLGFRTVDAAKSALADALDDRRCLLVIDDAWRVPDLTPFLHRGPKDHTTRLITTRDDGILPPDAARIAVDAMRREEAREVLSRGIPEPIAATLLPRLTALAKLLGDWPLLLGLANGVVRARIKHGASPADALAYAERAIAQRGIATAFRSDDPESRRRTAWGTLEASLDQLAAAEPTRFAELAVFVEDAEIPTSVALGLWRQTEAVDPLDGEDLLARLADLSLLWEFDLGRGIVRLHDVVRTLLREGPVKGRLAELDRHLVAHLRETGDGDLSKVSDAYGLRHLIAHLRGAGESDAARALLADPRWLSHKQQRLGIQALLADYQVISPTDAALDLIRSALILAAPALARNPRELGPQLLARLAPNDAAGLDAFLARVPLVISPVSLVPSRPTFTGPGAEVRRFEGQSVVTGVTVLADGRRALVGSEDGTLRLWDLETGTEVRRFAGHEAAVTGVTVLADGRHALSCSEDGTLRLWDLETGVEVRRFAGHEAAITSVTVLADGRRALVGSEGGTLLLWDLETDAEVRRLAGHEATVTGVTVLADGRHALSGSHDGTLRLWDLDTGAEVRRFAGHEATVTSVTLLLDGRRALSASWDRTLRLWDLKTSDEIRRFAGHEMGVTSVIVLPDGRRALSGSWDWTLRLWDVETGAEVRRFEGHEEAVTRVTVLPDGRRALSGSEDRTVRLWDLERGAAVRRFAGHRGAVTGVTVLADERRALSGSDDGTLRLWDLETGAEVRSFAGHQGGVTSVTLLADGRRALSGSRDGTLRLWSLETGEVRSFTGHQGGVTSVTVLADGRRALAGSRDGALRLWDLDTGADVRKFPGEEAVSSLTLLPDGQRAVSGARDGTLRLWDLDTGAEVRRFEGHQSAVTGVTVLPDGRRALSGSWDRTLRLWDLETGAEMRRFAGHETWVTSVTVLPDGRRALSGSRDKTLRLWNLETSEEVRRFEGHEEALTGVTVLAHGRRVLSRAADRTLRLWDIDHGGELARLTFDAVPTAVALSTRPGRLVVGDARGFVHVVDVAE